ncbi:MAG: hypothetical protein FWE76_01475 [Symbiobacteriaceae bacterium]|nr:hypothetical protein [Symbiobacteriaceae bacterium]
MENLIEEVFAPGGLLEQKFPKHEQRPGQNEMATQVLVALESRKHLAVQAGTGLGKTFAYLVPAALYAVEHQQCVVISTGTINLQNQIISKDIPALQEILRGVLEFDAALVKGRGNYICIRKLTAFNQANLQVELFREPSDADQWPLIADLFFTKKFVRGDRDEIPFRVADSLWIDLNAEADFCMKSRCPFYSDCYFYRARQQQKGAQLLITNHALFFADLAIRREDRIQQVRKMVEAEEYREFGEVIAEEQPAESGDFVLLNYDAVVFDEAQGIEDFATDCFTARFSWDRLVYLARTANSMLRPGGLLQWSDPLDHQRIESLFTVLLQRTELFLTSLARQWENERTVRFREPHSFEDTLSELITEVTSELNHLREIAQNEEQKKVLGGLSQRAQQLGASLLNVYDMPQGDEYAYWMEAGDHQLRQVKLASSPVSVAEFMTEDLLERVPVVLTSATLASELVQRLGLSKPHWLRVDSPFDYEHHTRLYLPSDAPEASLNNDIIFAEFVAQRVAELVSISRGRAFILFTSYRAMQDCVLRCSDSLADQGWPVLVQGEKQRDVLLSEFMAHGNAVLFAVNSFWEGVDVPGDALSLVVLVKLPFAVPTEPIQQARMEELQRQGRNPFESYTLPQAVLRLKQGFGRLIRNKQDTGVIAVLDKRILSKKYGARFLKDLPPAPRIHYLEEVAAFFSLLSDAQAAHEQGMAFVWPEYKPSIRQTVQSVPVEEIFFDDLSAWDEPAMNGSSVAMRRKK